MVENLIGFWLRLSALGFILCGVCIGLLVFISGKLPGGNNLAYSIAAMGGERIVLMDVGHRLKGSLSPSYRPYQNFYGWDSRGNFAFLSDREGNTEVYVWDGLNYTNISQHPFNDWRPTMSPDGRVAFASERDGNMEIYVWDRGQLTNVSQSPATDDYPAWSRDGRLAWMTNSDGDNEIDVWDGGQIQNVSQNPFEDDGFPAWGPDGRLAWFAASQGYLRVWVWDGAQKVKAADYLELSRLSWSADGKLVFMRLADMYVWDGQTISNVSQHPGQDFSPAWTPDGKLAFISSRGTDSDIYLWDGKIVERLTDDDAVELGMAWMP